MVPLPGGQGSSNPKTIPWVKHRTDIESYCFWELNRPADRPGGEFQGSPICFSRRDYGCVFRGFVSVLSLAMKRGEIVLDKEVGVRSRGAWHRGDGLPDTLGERDQRRQPP